MCEVQTRFLSGSPAIARFSEAIIDGGEYRRSLSCSSPENVFMNCA